MTNCALIIGINNYEHLPEDKHLNFAVRDAEAMRDFLRDVAKFPEENIVLCTDNSPVMEGMKTKPTGRNLRTILRQRIPAKVDNFWFFFTGHGMTSNHKDYLLPSDGDIYDPENLVSTNFIVDQLRDRHKAKNIVLVLDMCREFVILPEGGRDLNSVGEGTVNLAKQKGIVTIFACQRGEKSYEIGDEIQHGAFTYCLLQGLKQHTILKSLDDYIRREVPRLNSQKGKPLQIPLVIPEPGYRYDQPLFSSHITEADIQSLQEQAIDIELEDQSVETLEHAEEIWLEIIGLSEGKIKSKALVALRRIRTKIKRRKSLLSNQPTPKVEDPFAVVVVPIPMVQPVKPVEEVKPDLPSYSFRVITLDGKGQKIGEERGEAKYFREELGNGVTLDMVQIPGGEFWMGITSQDAEEHFKNTVFYGFDEGDDRGWVNEERFCHWVRVTTFFMGKFLVTQAQWKRVAAMKKVKIDLKTNPEEFTSLKEEELPIDSINWHEAVEFCTRLSRHTGKLYRLPSEAEWEYACRAGTETPFHFGATITPEYVNYDGNYPYAQAAKGEDRQKTTAVGSFLPNGFGLYDMHGNLGEWCEDDFHDSYEKAPRDGRAWLDNNNHSQRKNLVKVLRGGSWDYIAGLCRSGIRDRSVADYHGYDSGFRVACSSFLPRTP